MPRPAFPDGFKTTLSYDARPPPTREPIALLVQDSLKKIGVEVEIEKVPGADWYTRLDQKNDADAHHELQGLAQLPRLLFLLDL